MIQSYKQKINLEEKYDAIIIGSGIGSLCTAALLSKEGKKVLVLERHYTAGGFTHVFKRKGYEWDVGIHYIGEVQNPNAPIRKMFDYISNDKLKWADMGEVYDKIIIGNKTYDFVKGVKNFKAKMYEYFPNDIDAIDKYVQLIFDCNKTMKKFYLEKALPTYVSKLVGFFFRKNYLKYSSKTTYEVISSLTDNEDLIKVLTGQYGDYGLPPKQSSFAMHASVVKHYFNGGSFPIGGSSQIANTIDNVIESSKGTILVSAEVKKILINNNKASGVEMSDGKKFYSDLIVSGTEAGKKLSIVAEIALSGILFYVSKVLKNLHAKGMYHQEHTNTVTVCLGGKASLLYKSVFEEQEDLALITVDKKVEIAEFKDHSDNYLLAETVEDIEEEVLRLEQKEIEMIKKSLEKNKGKRKAAADELGISERTLYRKIKQFDL